MRNPFNGATSVELTAGEYDKLLAWRRSEAWDRFDAGPEIFEAKHISKTIDREETTAMRMGTCIHSSILEPELWESLAAPINLANRRGKAWTEHDTDCAQTGRVALLQREYDQVTRVTEAFRACKRAQRWLETASAVEETVIATTEHGLRTKARFDLRNNHLLIDLKSTSDPTPDGFAQSISKYGYWFQAAWYMCHEAARRCCDIDELVFVVIAVEKPAPHRVAIYELGPDWWEPGVAAVQWTLDRIAQEQKTGTWRSEWNGRPTMITPPAWFAENIRGRIGGEPC